MYFLSIFCQISKDIGAVLRGKLVLYTRINFTNRAAKKLSPVIIDSRLWLNNLLPKSAFPAARKGLQHPPASPAKSSFCVNFIREWQEQCECTCTCVLQVHWHLLPCHCTGAEKLSDFHSLAFCLHMSAVLGYKTYGLFCLAAWDLSLIPTWSKIALCWSRQQMSIPHAHLGDTLEIK